MNRIRLLTLALILICIALPCVAVEGDPVATLQQLLDDGEHDAVLEQGRSILETLTDDAVTEGAILDLMTSASYRAGRSSDPQTHELALRAIAVNERALGTQHATVARSINRYGLILSSAGDLEGSLEQQQRAMTIREAVLDPNDVLIADSANNLGDLFSRLARYDEAHESFSRALAIRTEVHGDSHFEVARILQNMGNNHLRMGDYVAARASYERSLTIREEVFGPEHFECAYTLISLGVLERSSGDYLRSRALYERALAICEKSLDEEHYLTLAARNNLGNLLSELGDYAAAIPIYESTLALREKTMGSVHPDVADSRHNLGLLHLRAGNPDRALPYIESALALYEQILGPKHPNLGPGNESLSNIALARGDLEEALHRAQTGFELRSGGLGPDHPDAAKSRLQLGAVHLARAERAEALAALEVAARSAALHLNETISYLPERQALAMVSAQIHPENVLFSGLLSAREDRADWLRACWNWILERRGVVQEEFARRSRGVLDEESQAAAQAWNDYMRARDLLGALWVEGPGDDAAAFSEKLRRARAEKEATERELAILSAAFRREATSASVAEVAEHLDDSELLVEFVRVTPGWPPEDAGPARDIALLLFDDGDMEHVDLGPADAIDGAARNWRLALDAAALARGRAWEIESAMAELDRTGRELRRLVWDPLSERLDEPAHLYLVPEGALHLVDLGSLPLEDGRFLIEEAPPLRLLDSGRDLIRFSQPRGRSGPTTVLAVGDVDFDSSRTITLAANTTAYRGPESACRDFDEMTWPALPESRRELGILAEIFPNSEMLSGHEATVEELRSRAPGKRILHLATHGFFLQGACEGLDDGENPLLLSGLIFAGANSMTETGDGIATAEELATMDLRDVELAVLSACDTGRGEIAIGEGVFGLRRAFDVAGASTIVMSLWPIPDDAARAWMSLFYRGIRDGLGAPESAQRASLERLRTLRAAGVAPHPELWTGFITVGDWKAVSAAK